MMIQLEVEVMIRKGLGPDSFIKHFPVAFDDLPDDTSNDNIKQMAKWEVDQQLYNTEDFPLYGRNWQIINYHFT